MTTVNEIPSETFSFRNYGFHENREALFDAGCDSCLLAFDKKIVVLDKENAKRLMQIIQTWLNREGD